ncbi:ribokinase [Roseovarius marisflavi]|uniref:Ribokinase n=1 Tax=Roseovarius marisflavi TaxID=1054996 RepID=A0A1M6XXK3_9RHOB|nr:ribokinase [Roseovarius marisflavi]SHL10636.1 ribokinase [Roseovarius marisflavi]
MIFNLGSINADHIYRLPHLPAPGETLAAVSYCRTLGGKGANQSVAAARAGERVCHIGAIGPDGDWMVDLLEGYGVEVGHVARSDTPSGHAVVCVDDAGENAIVIYPGANRALEVSDVTSALGAASPGDWLMMQNETNLQIETARLAQVGGLNLAYSAAPFDANAVREILPFVTLLMLNEVEARQLEQAIGEIDVPQLLITRGANGAEWRDRASGEVILCPAFPVTPVDTTGAGDTFTGYLVASLAQGLVPSAALRRASAAAALQVQRPGTAEAIPTGAETAAFLA